MRVPGGPQVWEMSGTGPRSGPAGATAPARRKARSQVSGANARRLREMNKARPAAHEMWETSGTGPRSGPAGATAPARRKARSQVSGANARRLREMKKGTAQ